MYFSFLFNDSVLAVHCNWSRDLSSAFVTYRDVAFGFIGRILKNFSF